MQNSLYIQILRSLYMYRLQHGPQLIMRVHNCRPCCNLLLSWPLTRWRLTSKHIIVQTFSSNPWN